MKGVVVAILFLLGCLTWSAGADSSSPFHYTSTSHNERGWTLNETSYYLMYAYAAYCPAEDIQNWNCEPYCGANDTSSFVVTKILTNETAATQAFTGFDPVRKVIVVSFRGTVFNFRNWIEDLGALLKTSCEDWTAGCKVGLGFNAAYNSIKQLVRNEVSDLVRAFPAFSVVMTGHSLGAAMSSLAAADIYVTLGVRSNVINFGEPRVGNDEFYLWWDDVAVNVTWRNTNKRDVIPHAVPPFLGFHHTRTEVWRNLEDKYVVCNLSGEDKECSDGVLDLSIYDHKHYLGVPLECKAASSSTSSESSSPSSSYGGSSSSSGSSSEEDESRWSYRKAPSGKIEIVRAN